MEGIGFFEIFAGALAALYELIPSYGLSIILLTVAVRLLLLPLSIKQTRSMREMQRIQPEVKKLQAKYKGDRQKLNEEMMKLYREHGVNPLGGCLPLLLQMPVFIALYRVLYTPLKYMAPFADSALFKALSTTPVQVNHFLGIQLNCSPSQILNPLSAAELADKSLVDRALLQSCGSGFVEAIPYLVLVGLMGFTTYYQQKQMQSSTGATEQAAQMQMMGRIMPVLLMFFAFNFPAGLTVYWLTTNLWTIGQQRLMLRAAPPLPPIGAGDGTAKGKTTAPPDTGKPPGKTTAKPETQARAAGATKPHPSSKKKKRR